MRWYAKVEVAPPILPIAERWLVDFWPIAVSGTPIPQSQSKGASSAKPVVFRAPMASTSGPQG